MTPKEPTVLTTASGPTQRVWAMRGRATPYPAVRPLTDGV